MNFKFLIIFITLFLFSCEADETVNLIIGDNILNVEVANTDVERATGLMNRESLDINSGMIFVFEKERAVSFWMKNTLIPLSIAYISRNGEILEIHHMKPLSLEPIASKRSSVLYALEVNEGYFKKNNIEAGDIIDLSEVKDYLNSSI